MHKLCQEINERLKEEEAQARMGELAAGGCWNCVSMERENYGSVSSQTFDTVCGSISIK